MVRVLTSFLRSPERAQARNWVMSLTWQCRECLSGRTNFNCCRSQNPMIDQRRRDFVYISSTASKRICFWTKFFSVMRLHFPYQTRWIVIWRPLKSASSCRTCDRQSEGGRFLCCKQTKDLGTILSCWDYHYGSRVHRYTGVLPCSTAGCKNCDLATSSSLPSQRCDTVPEPNIPGKMDRSWAATFRGHPHHPIWHPWTFHFVDSWKVMCRTLSNTSTQVTSFS
jgi:hypothetical protein